MSSSLLNLATTVVPVILMEEEGSAQMVPYVERELKKIPISLRERVSKTEMYIVLYVDMSTEEAIDVTGGIVIKSEHDLHRLRSSVLREGRSVSHLKSEEEVSSLLNLATVAHIPG